VDAAYFLVNVEGDSHSAWHHCLLTAGRVGQNVLFGEGESQGDGHMGQTERLLRLALNRQLSRINQYLIFVETNQRLAEVKKGQDSTIEDTVDKVAVVTADEALQGHFPHEPSGQYTQRLRIQSLGPHHHSLKQLAELSRQLLLLLVVPGSS
jgi:hypothetical protein